MSCLNDQLYLGSNCAIFLQRSNFPVDIANATSIDVALVDANGKKISQKTAVAHPDAVNFPDTLQVTWTAAETAVWKPTTLKAQAKITINESHQIIDLGLNITLIRSAFV